MQICWLIFLLSTFTFPSLIKSEIKPVLINKFELSHPGFLTLLRTWALNTSSWTLAISCFNPIPETTDSVYKVPDIEWQLTTQITPVLVTNKIVWPNGVVAADPLSSYSIIVPSGFLVPGKTNGNLYFIDKGDPVALVPDDGTNWFYHDAAFKDVDGDGYTDIVAGRANVPILSDPTTQLIWLKNPGTANITGPWKLDYLMRQGGPDIQVQFVHIDSSEVLFANSYFTRKLQMFWSDTDPYWNSSSKLHVRNIDYEPLQFAYARLTVDLNGDQIPDLLTTDNSEFNGSLIVYELPPEGHLLNGTFKRHVLASGFKPLTQARGRGAPGQGVAYQFYSLTVRKKPIIILSGDDDGCVYLLEAVNDNDPNNWDYTIKILHQSEKSTIGQISIEDVDNDGHPELFVPAYNEGIVYIYRLMDS